MWMGREAGGWEQIQGVGHGRALGTARRWRSFSMGETVYIFVPCLFKKVNKP